ncbi:uncharacterized protein VICG_00446 [Vittaforma corneae ATCC 50505]|uniref:T-complex protein 1, zeta subunit n=1 Tax=Vittaforma corneae (strain ATCC 50505) TaxID=993615 RepID=L2GN71_VITCO|nr:uncharacterized protein VICG_00446 [Vittaforma corneae ATCC 50505]ELA42348.1 hypothetical protein VICG_00446 [Vittaforma corneae ATCC 50505]
MESTSSEAQVTQSGQAIAINNICCSQLAELFGPMFGPNGSVKALLSGGQQLNLTKDGNSLCKDIQFTHPTSILITRTASSLYNSNGDGTIAFILLACECFKEAYKYYCEGTSLPLVINSLQLALKDVSELIQNSAVPLSDKTLRQLVFTSLSTKVRNPGFLVDIVLKAMASLNRSFDTNMIEILKMEEGDIADSIFVDGLVLDHGGRHYTMPTHVENVCVLTANMSLEYEKPEVNAEFCYSSAQQREQLALSEREFIAEKAKKIADLANTLKREGKALVLINEKGIDPYSLEILANAGVLALRRAKRRNLERLVNMCGGKLVTQVSQLCKENLGFCQKVTVKTINENKYTFIEGTPLKGSCTILLRGDSDYERISRSIKGTVNSLAIAIQTKCCIYGGIDLYKSIITTLNEKMQNVHHSDAVGYKILSRAFEGLIKTLLRNDDKNINEELVRLFRENEPDQNVVENIKVVNSCITNAVITTINLLMCDEIILAGKSINQGSKGTEQ